MSSTSKKASKRKRKNIVSKKKDNNDEKKSKKNSKRRAISDENGNLTSKKNSNKRKGFNKATLGKRKEIRADLTSFFQRFKSKSSDKQMTDEKKKSFEEYKQRNMVVKPWFVNHVLILIEDIKTHEQTAVIGKYKSDGKYKRCHFRATIIDISQAVDEINKMKKKVNIVKKYLLKDDDGNWIGEKQNAIELPIIHKMDRRYEPITIEDVSDNSSKIPKKINEGEEQNEEDLEKMTFREVVNEYRPYFLEGKKIKFSMSESPHILNSYTKGDFVVVSGFEYRDSEKGKHAFHLRATDIKKYFSCNFSDTDNMKYLFEKVYSLINVFDYITFVPTKGCYEENDKMIYPTRQKQFVFSTEKISEQFSDVVDNDSVKHVTTGISINRMMNDLGTLQILDASSTVLQILDDETGKFLKFEAKLIGFTMNGDKRIPTLDLFQIYEAVKLKTLLTNIYFDKERSNEYIPTNVPMVMLCKTKIKETSQYGEMKELLLDDYDVAFDARWAFDKKFEILCIVPDLYCFLKEQKMGIPLTPQQALMLILNQNDKFSSVATAKAIKEMTEKEYKKITKGIKFINEAGHAQHYMNKLFIQGDQKKGAVINVTQYNKDISGFFKDVADGNAEFMLWAADEDYSTAQFIRRLSTKDESDRDRRIESTKDVNVEKLDDLFGNQDNWPIKAGTCVLEIFIIYNKDL